MDLRALLVLAGLVVLLVYVITKGWLTEPWRSVAIVVAVIALLYLILKQAGITI